MRRAASACAYRPEQYRPRAPSMAAVELKREAQLAKADEASSGRRAAPLGAAPNMVLIDRWTTESRANYRDPSPTAEVALEQLPEPVDVATAVLDDDLRHCGPAEHSHVFDHYRVDSQNALVTGKKRTAAVVAVPKPRARTPTRLARTLGTAVRPSSLLAKDAKDVFANRDMFWRSKPRGPVSSRSTSAAARRSRSPTTRCGETLAQALRPVSISARLARTKRRSDAATQTSADGAGDVGLLPAGERLVFSTTFYVCTTCGKMHSSVEQDPKCLSCAVPLARLYAAQQLPTMRPGASRGACKNAIVAPASLPAAVVTDKRTTTGHDSEAAPGTKKPAQQAQLEPQALVCIQDGGVLATPAACSNTSQAVKPHRLSPQRARQYAHLTLGDFATGGSQPLEATSSASRSRSATPAWRNWCL